MTAQSSTMKKYNRRNATPGDSDEKLSSKTTMTGAAGTMQRRQEEKSVRTAVSVSRSMLLSFLSGFLHSLAAAIVKHMTNIHPAQILCYRFCIITSMCLPQITWHNEDILGPRGHRTVVYLRSIVAAMNGLLSFIAFRHLPIGEAAVIICSYPAFVTVAAKIFLNESFGLLQVISVVLTIVGMILVTGVYERFIDNSAAYTAHNIYGLAAALSAVLCGTLFFILTRKSKSVHHSILVFVTGMATVIECVIVVLVMDRFRPVYRGLQQFYIVLIGIFGYCGSSFLTIAAQNMDAGPVSTIKAASDIFFTFLWQVIISQDIPNSFRIAGALLVTLSIVLVGFSKQINAYLPELCVKFF